MADPKVDIGTGTTLTFASFVAEIKSISIGGIAREVLDTTHLGTTPAGANEIGSKTFLPGDLSDPGEISIEGHFDPSQEPPIESAASSAVITFPSTTTWTGDAMMTNYEAGIPTEVVMTFSATIKFTGPITVAAAV